MAKEDKKLPKLKSFFIFWLQGFSKDYVDINEVVRNTTFRKIRDIISTKKNWKRNERYVKWETVFFNLQKSCIVVRVSRCKGVMLKVN